MNAIEVYKKLSKPPEWALKKIEAGRLKGKTDINPQWRIQAMTEQFGMCGLGWKYTVDKLWTEVGAGNEVTAWAQISLYFRDFSDSTNGWSDAIIGIGGNFLVAQERAGLHNNDEAYKMSVTDALSVAMKMLGVGADVYAGQIDGSKYSKEVKPYEPSKPELPPPPKNGEPIFDDSAKKKGGIQAINKAKTLPDLVKVEEALETYYGQGDMSETTYAELKELIKQKAEKING